MPRKKLHKATLKGTIALYKKRKLPHPVSSANNWKLDNLIPKMLEANKVCKEISNSNS